MTITEMMRTLSAIYNKHGDVRVCILDSKLKTDLIYGLATLSKKDMFGFTRTFVLVQNYETVVAAAQETERLNEIERQRIADGGNVIDLFTKKPINKSE